MASTTTEVKAKRSQYYTFLNIGTSETPEWAREGKFASELTAQMNPQTTTVQDVTQDTAETDITVPKLGIVNVIDIAVYDQVP